MRDFIAVYNPFLWIIIPFILMLVAAVLLTEMREAPADELPVEECVCPIEQKL